MTDMSKWTAEEKKVFIKIGNRLANGETIPTEELEKMSDRTLRATGDMLCKRAPLIGDPVYVNIDDAPWAGRIVKRADGSLVIGKT